MSTAGDIIAAVEMGTVSAQAEESHHFRQMREVAGKTNPALEHLLRLAYWLGRWEGAESGATNTVRQAQHGVAMAEACNAKFEALKQ